ncbi:amino acid ABC transporter permease [Pseudomonas monteilii]|uniref:amino acid ABC transporter permease n=1 Tax=Pseudomonas monteilii TaxID=76759 RepID=UPI003CFF6AB8
MNYSWNWHVLFEPSPTGEGMYLNLLFEGLGWTIVTTLCAWAVAMGIGICVGIARTRDAVLAQIISRTYIAIFRNIPILVQLFLWFFVLPEIVPVALSKWLKGLEYGPFYTAVCGIGFAMSARVAEQVRSGIQALSLGQSRASFALGMSTFQVYRHILLPQALRYILPTLTTELTTTVKATSVALTIGLTELSAQAHAVQEFSFQVFEAFTTATLIYIGLNAIVALGMRLIEKATAIPGATSARS